MKAKVIETKSVEKEIDRAPREIKVSYETWARLIEEHGLLILKRFRGYRDEALKGAWDGYRSSRLNRQWRVIYSADQTTDIQIIHVEKITPHDYRRKQ
ncbi:MAG: type II toxin-antitoxin system mRNA interferase toxin, RelE/StbE family [Oligoflexales bacterium]|nr:type II toxin-antitoxin system mRNA interferase toxin, RelE/StbE family [Oligoflexales bacterium]